MNWKPKTASTRKGAAGRQTNRQNRFPAEPCLLSFLLFSFRIVPAAALCLCGRLPAHALCDEVCPSVQAKSHAADPAPPEETTILARTLKRIRIGFDATTALQGAWREGRSGFSSRDELEASGSIDLEATWRVSESCSVYGHVESGVGAGLDGRIPSLTGFNGDADDDPNLRLTELWFRIPFAAGGAAFTAGKINLAGPGDYGPPVRFFDANDLANNERNQFLSPMFINSVVLPFPDPGPGAILEASLAEWFDVGIGAADADIDPETGESDPDWGRLGDSLFCIVEAAFHPTLREQKGSWRIYGWIHDAGYPDVRGLDEKRCNWGWGLSLDQTVRRDLAVFGRVGWQRPEAARIEFSWSLGAQLSMDALGRESDALGLAFGAAGLSEPWREAFRAAGGDPADELHLECYYNWRAGAHVLVSPDFQCIWRPDGCAGAPPVWTLGCRIHLFF